VSGGDNTRPPSLEAFLIRPPASKSETKSPSKRAAKTASKPVGEAPKSEIVPEAVPTSPEANPAADPAAEGRTELERLVLRRLDDEKAQDIVFIDVKDRSPFADALVVASGRSARHVGAMTDHLLRALKDAGRGRARVEGVPQCDWVLIDAGDVIVHLFRPEVRAYYNIEKIWTVDSPHRRDASAETAGGAA
jgi:ribosome-associated protein